MRRIYRMLKRVVPVSLVFALLGSLSQPAEAQYFSFGKNKVQYESFDWHFLQSRHFDIYYSEPTGRYVAEYTARAAERAYAQISSDFQHQISERVAIVVYLSHNEFAVTNVADLPADAEGIGGVTELFKNRIAIPFTGNYRDYRRVLHHEIVHSVINDMFYGGSIQSIIQNNIQVVIPLWFNEGISEYSSFGWDSQSDMWMRDAIVNNYLPPVPYLGGFLAYRGGQGIWDYIAEQYGREKISEIMQRLRLSRSVEGAFRRSIGLSMKELSERWHKALKEVHWPEIAAREDVDVIAKAIVTREDGMFYNTSPALSPQGDQMAFISTKDGFFNVYLANASDGRIIRRLVRGNDNTLFESLKILNPNLSWSPDGRHIALAAKSGASDAIALVNVRNGSSRHFRIPNLLSIVSVAWSPDGKQIAFEGSDGTSSDIFILNLETKETINLTNDIFSNHEPAWSPDGKALVFHSDRKEYLALGVHTTENFDMGEHDHNQLNLYRLVIGEDHVERLSFEEIWDSRSGRFGDDPNRLLFISDRNGIFNLYEKNLETGAERPITDVVVGITQFSLSADGKRVAFVSLKEGTPSIYTMTEPFERQLERTELAPSVWAQRVMQETHEPAPAIALASQNLLRQNPLLRDAVDGQPYLTKFPQSAEMYASRLAPPAHFASVDTSEAEVETPDLAAAQPDTTAYGSVRVDFRNYVFSEAFDEARPRNRELPASRFEIEDNIDEEGNFKPRKYRLSFSPDIIYGTAQFDNLYGMQSVTQMMFSDMLGNHRIFAATNLLIDLRNSDYLVAYSYLPHRINWTGLGFHISRILPDYNNFTYIRYRYYGMGASASYPLDKFRRLDLDLSVVGVSQTDIQNPTTPTTNRTLINPSLTYTKDVTVPGFLSPSGGYRYALSLYGSPGSISGRNIQFGTILGDFRWYGALGRGYTVAMRASGAHSFGPNAQLFYASGVQNWINYRFDGNRGFPIEDITDFVFATPVLPLRAYDINSANGSNFGLLNAEFRFPLVAALLPGPIPIIPLYNIQGVGFVDAGSIWGGQRGEPFNFTRTDESGRQVFDSVLMGAGFGLRTILLGFPVRLDWAWPYNGQEFGERRVYFSIGLDF